MLINRACKCFFKAFYLLWPINRLGNVFIKCKHVKVYALKRSCRSVRPNTCRKITLKVERMKIENIHMLRFINLLVISAHRNGGLCLGPLGAFMFQRLSSGDTLVLLQHRRKRTSYQATNGVQNPDSFLGCKFVMAPLQCQNDATVHRDIPCQNIWERVCEISADLSTSGCAV